MSNMEYGDKTNSLKHGREVLIEVKGLKKYFPVKDKTLKAVDDVSFKIYKGETLGLVGESGCGKTTCGRTILGLYKATEGEVLFNDANVHDMKPKEALAFKKNAQIIFQDPYASLDPRMTIGNIIREGMDVHIKEPEKSRNERVTKLLKQVGLNQEHSARFAHELSGGQRQRIGIARALAVEPQFIVCDEPISALDVSIQAQIVNLMIKLQQDMGLTYLFISHDLSMVKHISDRIGVMYLGSLIELGNTTDLYKEPLHPYTKALISSIPVPSMKKEDRNERIKLTGEVPSPINPPEGCKFVKRCSEAMDCCHKDRPKWVEVSPDRFVACHKYSKI